MPTLTITREAPLELIRQCPDLAVDLVRAMTGIPLPADPKADLGPTGLDSRPSFPWPVSWTTRASGTGSPRDQLPNRR